MHTPAGRGRVRRFFARGDGGRYRYAVIHLLPTLLAAVQKLDKPLDVPRQQQLTRGVVLFTGLLIAVFVAVVILMIARRIARREMAKLKNPPRPSAGQRSAWEVAGERAEPISAEDFSHGDDRPDGPSSTGRRG